MAPATSTISVTDIEVFKRLANPTVVDVQVESRARRASAEMRQAIEKAAAAVPAEEPGSPASSVSTARKSVFRQAQARAAAEATELFREEARATSAASRDARQLGEKAASQEAASQEAAQSAPVLKAEPLSDRALPAVRPVVRPDAAERARDENSSSETEEEPRPPPRVVEGAERRRRSVGSAQRGRDEEANEYARDDEATRLEKQGYLIELSNMRQKGVQLSREFTMNDTLAELEFEIQKQNNNSTTRQHVVFMRDMMKIGINGLEIANARLGPFLSIDGWAESVTSDMTKYEAPLEKLYRRYFRSSQMSPIMELSWLLIGSMVAFHFRNKWFQPPNASRAGASKSEEAPREKPREKPRSTRPVLRPPASLFGLYRPSDKDGP